ncbi:hypothetical protein SBF1_480002 [Candidatus Desulfosporosinus infrequens]|uniref:Uncharacterized protein n=1 Tax=Candidatus Desulfosporosinus infrequens TaxID=2043169 RepID=A0A2U3LER9_9FIRM|nr:hypothetical protein SBF1_480002 [Candidatus Desulfosporosinus infrequens]
MVLVQQIATLHHGSLDVQSMVGQEMGFRVNFSKNSLLEIYSSLITEECHKNGILFCYHPE